MTIQSKGAFLWLGAGIGGAAMAGPLVPFGLFLVWSSRRCAATAEERGWAQPIPTLSEVKEARQSLVESVAVAEPRQSKDEDSGNSAPAQGARVEVEKQQLEALYQDAVREEVASAVATATAPTAMDAVVATPFESRAILGSQRTGKTFFAAEAAKKTGAKVFYLNLGAYADPEDGAENDRYFGTGPNVISEDLLTCYDSAQASQIVGKAIDLVNRFYSCKGAAILIVDEWVIIGDQNHAYSQQIAPLMDRISTLAVSLSSAGMKRRKAVWGISPQFVAGNLTQAAKALKALKPCYLSISPGRSVDWKGQAITFNETLYSQVGLNWKGLEHPGYHWQCDRVCWLGGRWVEVGL